MTRSALTALALASLLAPAAAHAEPGGCLALRVPVATGEFLTAEMTEESACRDGQPLLPLHYDRAAGAPVVTETLAVGTYLGRLALPAGPIVAAGQKLSLVVRTGPVTVMREVRPMQPVRAGRSGFVRTQDGQVMAARFVASEVLP